MIRKITTVVFGIAFTAAIIFGCFVLGMRAEAQWYAEDRAKMLEAQSGYTVDYDVIETSFGHYKVVRSTIL